MRCIGCGSCKGEKMIGEKIYNTNYCAACYFRTIAEYPSRKCLIQLTERCNLHCEHCFVSAGKAGKMIDFDKFENQIVPQLVKNNVKKVTLTGGEPFVYPKLINVINLLNSENIHISICTNATLITEEFLQKIECCKSIHFNVSLDGFSADSHGRFRGNSDKRLFETILNNIELLGEKRLLNGILVTPNIYSSVEEYEKICAFAKKNHANYVLMNPLSEFGRGESNMQLAMENEQMDKIRNLTQKFNDDEMEMVYIRFPNSLKKPLSECVAGKIMYIFSDGDIAYCPYLVFASMDKNSIYSKEDFIIGNIFEKDFDWEEKLKNYKFPVCNDEVCKECDESICKKGCYAAKVSKGKSLSEKDEELCPKVNI